jgi:hypothetical protein
MVILGVDAGERADSESARAALGIDAAKRHQLNYPVLLNGDPVMEQYEASGFPTTYLIDPGGRIAIAQVGVNPDLWPRVEAAASAFQPPAETDREGMGGPRKASQILHELTFPVPPGPHEWIVGRDVTVRFQLPTDIPADLIAFSVDGKQVAAFGPSSSYAWDATSVNDGPHTLRIAAQTASGRETWAVQQMVMVDNRPPVESAPPHRNEANTKARKVAKARKG